MDINELDRITAKILNPENKPLEQLIFEFWVEEGIAIERFKIAAESSMPFIGGRFTQSVFRYAKYAQEK